MKLAKIMATFDTNKNTEQGCPNPQMFYLECMPSSKPSPSITTVINHHFEFKDTEFSKFFGNNHTTQKDGNMDKAQEEAREKINNRKLEKCSCVRTFHLDIYQFSYLMSQLYYNPRPVNDTSVEKKCFLKIVVHQPSMHPIDYKSNDIANMSMVEKRELEHSMNWLSTLGGAFSALGENSIPFAQRAGRVSKGQFLIAMKLGSPQTMSRCRLYAAISLLQIGKLKLAREILKREYAYAMSLPDDSDPRLRRMCIGIWAKLQYEWKLNRAKSSKQETKRTNGTVKSCF